MNLVGIIWNGWHAWCAVIRNSSFHQIGNKRIHKVRTRGGNVKYRAMRLDYGNYSWGSEGKRNEECQPLSRICTSLSFLQLLVVSAVFWMWCTMPVTMSW